MTDFDIEYELARHDWARLTIACPTCGVAQFEPCVRSIDPNPYGDEWAHIRRMRAAFHQPFQLPHNIQLDYAADAIRGTPVPASEIVHLAEIRKGTRLSLCGIDLPSPPWQADEDATTTCTACLRTEAHRELIWRVMGRLGHAGGAAVQSPEWRAALDDLEVIGRIVVGATGEVVSCYPVPSWAISSSIGGAHE